MVNKENYSKAYLEVETVLLTLDDSLKKKIPQNVMKSLAENKDKEYIFVYDFNKTIDKQDISTEAKIMLAKIYKDYLCSDEEREKWKEFDLFRLTKIEEHKKQKYKCKYFKFKK